MSLQINDSANETGVCNANIYRYKQYFSKIFCCGHTGQDK